MLKTSDCNRIALITQIIGNNKTFYLENSLNILLEFASIRNQDIQANKNLNNTLKTVQSEMNTTSTMLTEIACKLQETENRLQESENRFDETKNKLGEIEKKLHETENWLQEANKKNSACNLAFTQSQFQLNELRDSKTFKILAIYLEARRSIRMSVLAPFRIACLFLPTKMISPAIQYYNKFNSSIENITNKVWPGNHPLISVIIPCFNYGQYVEAAIDSVLNQTFQNFEIIIIDGGSTDVATIKKLNMLTKDNTTIYYRQDRHLVGDNRNFGIEKAQGKYICCLDADDMIKSTYLEKAVFMAECYNYDIVYPSVQCFEGSHHIWTVNKVNFLSCTKGDNISTVALFKKDAWKKVKGYRDWGLGEDHVPEDWDFWVRLLGHGCRAMRLIEPLMLYRVHSSGLTANNKKSIANQEKTIKDANKSLFSVTNLGRLDNINKKHYSVNNPFVNLHQPESSVTNILFALPFMMTGGADTVLLQIAKHLSANKFHISCITTVPYDTNWGDNSSNYNKITNEIYHLCQFLETDEHRKNFVFYLLESRNIKVIFLVGCEFIYHLIPEIKTKYPYIKIVDQLYNEYGHITNNRKYSNFININIVENEIIHDVLINKHNETPDKISLIHNGVDVNTFSIQKISNKTEIYRKYNISANKFIVSFLGRFSEEKGPDVFVHIANHFKNDENIFFIMGGHGILFNHIESLIKEFGLEHKILLPGFVDTKEILSITDVVIVPSTIDGRPNIVLESFSMGVPVITSKVGGLPTLIAHAHNGFLSPAGSVENFAKYIQRLFDDPSLKDKMSSYAREYAINNLNITDMNVKYLHVFNDLVQ